MIRSPVFETQIRKKTSDRSGCEAVFRSPRQRVASATSERSGLHGLQIDVYDARLGELFQAFDALLATDARLLGAAERNVEG